MALDDLLRINRRFLLEVVDVLSVICQELALLLQKLDEPMCRTVSGSLGRNDMAYDVVEALRILLESLDMEQLLWIADFIPIPKEIIQAIF